MNPKKLREMMEGSDSYLVKCLGTTKTLLAYITHEEPEVPASADDPAGDYTLHP
jgi:hypothetical protein